METLSINSKAENIENHEDDYDVFSSFQWKQAKDGKIHFLHINTEENKNSSIEFKDSELNEDSNDKIHQMKKNSKIDRNERIFDNSDKLKVDKFVITEWGLGKIIKKENQIVYLDIYGNPAEFAESSIKINYCINVLVLINENAYLLDLKVDASTTINKLKKKIAEIVNSHGSLIVLVHRGRKVEDEKSLLELEIYDRDNFMAVVKDSGENFISRNGNTILNSKYNNNFNAVRFKCDEDIILTAVGLYRNENVDILYDLLIYEEKEGNPQLIFNEKKVLVLKKSNEGDEIFKYTISHIKIKKNKIYQIHQNILNSDNSSQYSGIGFHKEVESRKSKIKFQFLDCNLSSKINGSNSEKGLIPSLYFLIKTDDDL